VDEEYYNCNIIASPFVNEASMFLILIIICMARIITDIDNVKRAFLNRKFSKEQLYMEVLASFERFYPSYVVFYC
jgi:hypothetical protein